MNATKRTPQLRFPEFAGEWQEKRLGEIAINKPSTITAGQLSDNFEGYAVYGASGIAGYVKSFQHEQPYTAVIKDGAGAGRLLWHEGETSVLSTLTVLLPRQSIDAGYLHYVLQGIDFSKYMTGSTIPHVYYRDFSKAKLKVPTLEEQQKIAAFLAVVDKRVALLERKVQQLEAYKRGVIQQLFSQQLRFTRPDGSHFPAWQEKRLGGIGVTYSGLSGKSGPDFGVGSPYITYVQIFQNSYIQGSFGKVSIGSNEKQNKVQEGDIFFTTSSETPDEAGYTSVLLAAPKKDTYLNSFCFGYRLKDKNTLLPEFAQYLFRSTGVRRNIVRLAQGSTRYNISKKSVMSLTIRLPLLEEQQKIAAFLSALDEKIALTRQQLDKTKQFKKGLLQRMFV